MKAQRQIIMVNGKVVNAEMAASISNAVKANPDEVLYFVDMGQTLAVKAVKTLNRDYRLGYEKSYANVCGVKNSTHESRVAFAAGRYEVVATIGEEVAVKEPAKKSTFTTMEEAEKACNDFGAYVKENACHDYLGNIDKEWLKKTAKRFGATSLRFTRNGMTYSARFDIGNGCGWTNKGMVVCF